MHCPIPVRSGVPSAPPGPVGARWASAARKLAHGAAALATITAACLQVPSARAQEPPAQLPRIELNVGIHLIHAELANTDASRMLGLMFRDQLAPNHGMLFTFVGAGQHCMWMRNTYLPLSVAFLDQAGAVINVEEMKPQTDDSHCAQRPASFALEMSARWFSEHGVRPGAVIEGVGRIAKR